MRTIYIRQSPDWENMTEDLFFSQSFTYSKDYWQSVLKKIWKSIKQWNKNCNISYFQYRQELQKIAIKNIGSLNSKIILKNHDLNLTKNIIFIPVDDDDWISPDAFETIEKEILPNTDVIIWNHTIIDSNGKIKYLNNKTLFTNNFAITESGIKKLKIIPKSSFFSKWLRDKGDLATTPFHPHYDLHRRIIKTNFIDGKKPLKSVTGDHFEIIYIDKELSITNKTLSSASVLMEINNDLEFLQKLHNLSSQQINNVPIWATEEISKLNSLNNMLKTKQLKFI